MELRLIQLFRVYNHTGTPSTSYKRCHEHMLNPCVLVVPLFLVAAAITAIQLIPRNYFYPQLWEPIPVT